MSDIETVRDNWDTQTFVDGTGYSAYVEWGSEGASPTIWWTENLEFHRERCGVEGDEGDDLLREHVAGRLPELLPEGFTCHAYGWDEALEGQVFIEVWRDDLTPDMPAGEAWGKLWPAIATLFNVTDPGTHNSPYLFTGLKVPTCN